MQDQYSRTQMLLGAEAMEKLHNSRVAVFGIGGVGGYTVEALARSGVHLSFSFKIQIRIEYRNFLSLKSDLKIF